jgi:hypothetical protein
VSVVELLFHCSVKTIFCCCDHRRPSSWPRRRLVVSACSAYRPCALPRLTRRMFRWRGWAWRVFSVVVADEAADLQGF